MNAEFGHGLILGLIIGFVLTSILHIECAYPAVRRDAIEHALDVVDPCTRATAGKYYLLSSSSGYVCIAESNTWTKF